MFFKNSPPRARKPYLGGVIIAGLLTALFLAPIAHKVEADDPTPQSLFGHGAFSCTKVSDHFGRMFPRLPSASWPRPAIDALATATMAEEEEEQTPEGQVDDEENLNIDAGFTYVGQFIDHDLTLDPRPNDLTTPIDPRTLVNSRTPAFDLDSVYGGGPIASPQLYQADHVHLKLGAPLTGAATDPDAVDLPRDANGQALLGDPRNDENRIVASLHAIMLRFHNDWVDRIEQAAQGLEQVSCLRRGAPSDASVLPVRGPDRLPADNRWPRRHASGTALDERPPDAAEPQLLQPLHGRHSG